MWKTLDATGNDTPFPVVGSAVLYVRRLSNKQVLKFVLLHGGVGRLGGKSENLYMLDLTSNQKQYWKLLNNNEMRPSARSNHTMNLWKNYAVLFGGEIGSNYYWWPTGYSNDMYLLNFGKI